MLRPTFNLKWALSLHGDVNLKFDLARHVLRNINHNYENVQRWRQKSSVAALESDAVALAESQSLPSLLHCSHRRQESNILSFSGVISS